VAPAVFDGVLEYPLALAAVPLLLLGLPRAARGRSTGVRRDPVRVVSAVLAVVIAGVAARVVASLVDGVTDRVLLVVAVLAVAWLLTRHRVLPLVAVLALCAPALWVGHGSTVESSRTFYGTYRVIEAGGTHTLVHGTTNHGTQFQDPARRRVPTTYYARGGPLGSVFSVLANAPALRVGVVGLGTGTIATYGRPGDEFTFFEIDPEVVRIARDPDLFAYLAESRADVSTLVGDGRLNLQKTAPGTFDLLVLDAFSSDAIPVHLMTRQAVELYASRLRPGGVLMFHITNRVFDLKPVLASAARSSGLEAVVGTSNATGSGATPTQWVALTRDERFADELRSRTGWEPLRTDRPVAWTDDYSSVLSVLQ
jgi:hypothetical protein